MQEVKGEQVAKNLCDVLKAQLLAETCLKSLCSYCFLIVQKSPNYHQRRLLDRTTNAFNGC